MNRNNTRFRSTATIIISIVMITAILLESSTEGLTQSTVQGKIVFQVIERLDNKTIVFTIHSTLDSELKIESGEGLLTDPLYGKMFNRTFDQLVTRLQQLGITEVTSNESGNVTVYLDYGTTTVNITYDSADPSMTEIHQVITDIIDRYSGKAWHSPKAWPLDIDVGVLESFPEQYAVQTVVQRGADPFAIVLNVGVQLTVFPKNDSAQILQHQERIAAIASGGQSTTVTFDTFSVGAEFRPEDLLFQITVEENASLFFDLQRNQLHASTDLPPVNTTQSTGPLLSDMRTTDMRDGQRTEVMTVDVATVAILGVAGAGIVIRRQWRSSGSRKCEWNGKKT